MLKRQLENISSSLKTACALVEGNADPDAILVNIRQVRNALHVVQMALVRGESAACIAEVAKFKGAPSKTARLNAHIELLSRYGR